MSPYQPTAVEQVPRPPKGGSGTVAKQTSGDFRELASEIVAWQRETFPKATPESIVAHLAREVLELADDPFDREEAADVLHLLIGLAAVVGFDLVEALRVKFERNKARRWGGPDASGVVEHVSEGA